MPKRFYFVAHGGVVQGVGFRSDDACARVRKRDQADGTGAASRYFTRAKAREYGVTGWCRNTDDNKVEGEAQGEDEALQKFFKDVDDGPRHARVVQLTKEDRLVVDGEESFSVRH
ncbi:Acylphosphatase [Purpureocillium lavendulum]|uniref:acylphosphatase n=1 Tax=Purpureocillium lavendulum TaxID=1247861 RepID=A0AB34G5M1_9HYPO|nr:Acylphosphatase [Purpureocillium lavendulum]